MSLYLKYRPTSLSRMRGNTHMLSTLANMLSDKETCPHVFLLYGPTGVGKTTVGRIIAKELGCEVTSNDFHEINTADLRGIDTIRDIIKKSHFKTMESDCMLWIIDEAHKATNEAQNALLKILEDTPNHVYFVLCTTEPQKLLATIRGRCSQFQLKPLNDTEMYNLLRRVVKSEGEELEDEVYNQIIKDSIGLPRNALQILEQVLKTSPEQRLEIAKQTAAEQFQVIELCRALFRRASWKEVSLILKGLDDQEPETIRRAVLGYCKSVLLKEDNVICGLILEEFINPFYDSGFPQLVYAAYSVTKNS